MKTKRSLIIGFSFLLFVGVLVAGCTGAREAGSPNLDAYAEATEAAQEFDEADGESFNGAPEQEPAGGDAAMPPGSDDIYAEATGEPAERSADEGGVDQDGNPLVAALPQDRLIIKNGEIALLVEDADVAVNRTTQVATD